MKKSIFLFLLLCLPAMAQTPFALMPIPRQCFYDSNGAPVAGGQLFSYQAGTTTPLATFTDSTGAVNNPDPVILDASGCALVFIGPSLYKIALFDSLGSQLWTTDNVSDVGQLLYTKAVLLAPAGASLQTIVGPLGADYFQQNTPHFTSPGVRVSLLDALTSLDTTQNPPQLATVQPVSAGQVYSIPDPATPFANFVLNPNPTGHNTNVLDCTQAGITCVRSAYMYFEGGGCNNATAGLGWDTFGSNAPTPICITGTNVQKGVLAFPSAMTHIQENTGSAAAAGTCTTTYPAAIPGGNADLLIAVVSADTSRTISSVTDGTNAYTAAVTSVSGVNRVAIYYFNGNPTTKVAGTTLTVTLSANGNCAVQFLEYTDKATGDALDKTASANGISASLSTGTTALTTQAVELVIGAGMTATGNTQTAPNGWTPHTNVTVTTATNSAGLIQQVAAAQNATFVLSGSDTWVGAIATFKANVGAASLAQRQFMVSPFFYAASPVNSFMKWQAPQVVAGSPTVSLSSSWMCTADGATDDTAFTNKVTQTPTVPNSGANTLNTTSFLSLPTNGTTCAPNNLGHLRVSRNRYDAADTYEGFVEVNGVSLQMGITQ